jgi:NADH-ubiquinone oxidoreductase chain 6
MFVASNNWDGFLVETSHITTVGLVLYSVYNIWLIISSLILVLAMVGSIIITLNKN